MKINEVKIGKDKKNANNLGKGVKPAKKDGLAGNFRVADNQERLANEQIPTKVEALRDRTFTADILPFTTAYLDIGSSNYEFSNIYLVNAPTVSSDERTQSDIVDLPYGLAEINQIQTKKYKQKKNKDRGDGKNKKEGGHLGVLAQQVMPVIPEVVEENLYGDDYMGVRYEELIPVLIKAVQELSAEVDKLKKEPK